MNIQFFIFFSIILIIILGINLYIYLSTVYFFSIDKILTKRLVLGCLVTPSPGFILISILSRQASNGIIKYLYLLTASWWGLIAYLMIAATILWIIWLIAKLSGLNFNYPVVAWGLMLLALLAVITGLLGARQLETREINVAIKSLPPEWQGRRIVQISDVHLGILNNEAYMKRVNKAVAAIQPDLIFITGDYFDGTCPDLDKIAAPLGELSAPKGIYFINGNHETYIGVTLVEKALKKYNVNYLRNDIVDIEGVNIVGLDYPERGQKQNAKDVLAQVDKNKPSILLYHEPRYIEIAKEAGIDLQLAGHTHQGQFFPFNLITRLIYGRFHHGFNRENDYNIYTTSGTATWGPPLRLGSASEIVVIKFNNQ